SGVSRELHSFPPRRSSDLAGAALTADQGRGLVDVIAHYTQTFLWLQRYDEGLLTAPAGSPGGVLPTLEEARAALARLKEDLMARSEEHTSELQSRENLVCR